MKTIDLATQTPTVQELLELADQDNLLLKTPDGREFVLAETEDLSREVEQVQRNTELMQFLAQRSQELQTYSLSQIRQKLGL